MRPSTNSSGRAGRSWSGFGAVTITCAIILGTELALRVIAPAIPAPTTWSPPEAAAKAAQMETRSAAGATGGVVLVGTSVMDVALDPAGLQLAQGLQPAYNASLSGVDLRVLEWWTASVVVPTLKPDVVVLGLSSHEVNPYDDEASRNSRDFFAAPAVRRLAGTESRLHRLERRVGDLSTLFRYRSVLRKPGQLVGLAATDSTPRLSQGGMNQIYAGARYDRSPPVDGQFREHVLRRFQVGREQLESLRRLLEALSAAGVRAILVDMPVTEHYLELHPNGPSDYYAYQRAIADVAHTTGTEMRTSPIWEESLFADAFHLNSDGSRRFTASIAELLSGQGPIAQ